MKARQFALFERTQLLLWFPLFGSTFQKPACPTQALRGLGVLPIHKVFFKGKNQGSHLAKAHDDRFPPQSRENSGKDLPSATHALCTSQFQNHPPPGQPPGIWLALSSVQWGIWPKMRPARWGIWLSCQNVCQRSETKGFRNSKIPRGLFCCYILYSYIVISQNMPLWRHGKQKIHSDWKFYATCWRRWAILSIFVYLFH